MKNFEVIFYEDIRGTSPVADWLMKLDRDNSKASRSMLRKIYFQIERLENEGICVGEPIVKRINKAIWELRPLPNRIFFATLSDNKILLLHFYRKKSNRTPLCEINQAVREYYHWLKEVHHDEMV
jgi:phage-related protein